MTIRTMTCCSALATLLTAAGCASLNGASIDGARSVTTPGQYDEAMSLAGRASRVDRLDHLAEPIDCFYVWYGGEPECTRH